MDHEHASLVRLYARDRVRSLQPAVPGTRAAAEPSRFAHAFATAVLAVAVLLIPVVLITQSGVLQLVMGG